MEEEGVIRRRVALLDPVKVNTKVTVFVSVRTNSHSMEWLRPVFPKSWRIFRKWWNSIV